MASTKQRRTPGNAEKKVAKTYRLSPAKIEKARRILGAETATAAIETALDLVVFRQELVEGTRAMRGTRIARFDERDK